MPPTHPTLVERFSTILLGLNLAVAARSGGDKKFAMPMIALIMERIRQIQRHFARLADRVRAGRYAPRRSTAPRHRQAGRRTPNPLPQGVGWLLKRMPEVVGYRGQFEFLLRDEEMVALLAAAPASLGRPLRSLCRMLLVDPPAILPPPKSPAPKPRAPKPERPPARQRQPKPERVRYVFGLRYPPPFPNPV